MGSGRRKRSCETQLVMLVDEIAENMQTGKQIDLILLDFSKAFDKVAHEKLDFIGTVYEWYYCSSD